MSVLTLVLFLVGVALLIVGAEMLVRGSSRLAGSFGVSPLVIGLTIVALGTSAPELAVTLRASFTGQADIGVGNIIGSNICNTLLILGVAALIAPLIVSEQLVRLDVPIMILASVALLVMAQDGRVSMLNGSVLVAALLVYTIGLIRKSRRDVRAERARNSTPEPIRPRWEWLSHFALVVVGLALLVLGSRWLVDGAVVIAGFFGVSQLVIGLTVVAIGTSMPEVATSVLAGLRGEREIAVGNVVGSNLYNILAVLGISAFVAPDGIAVAPAAINFDIPVMVATAAACLPIFYGGRISRPEGLIFVGYYVAYTFYVIMSAASHDALPQYSIVMTFFVLPLTGITLVVLIMRELGNRQAARRP
jgi:cation:H+ antiporter